MRVCEWVGLNDFSTSEGLVKKKKKQVKQSYAPSEGEYWMCWKEGGAGRYRRMPGPYECRCFGHRSSVIGQRVDLGMHVDYIRVENVSNHRDESAVLKSEVQEAGGTLFILLGETHVRAGRFARERVMTQLAVCIGSGQLRIVPGGNVLRIRECDHVWVRESTLLDQSGVALGSVVHVECDCCSRKGATEECE